MTALPAALAGPGKRWHRFLSPHYDDIALCCGGTVVLLARAGLAPEVAIVFAEGPDPAQPLTPFARMQHAEWGLAAEEVVARRRREELVCAEVLGTTVRFLPFRDAIYREGRYQSDAELFGETAPAEGNLPARIVSALGLDARPDPAVRVYAPLAVGRHVDHQHVFAAGVALARADWEVWFYEDVPYSLRADELDARLGELSGAAMAPEPAAVIDVGSVWARKLAGVFAYPSQLARVFGFVGGDGSAEDVDRRLRAYAARAGNGALVERFWRIGTAHERPG